LRPAEISTLTPLIFNALTNISFNAGRQSWNPPSAFGATTMKTHSIAGGGGLRLHVREWGKANGRAILFIHGWSQNHLCWRKQYESELADAFRLVAFDLRGHGMSEAPQAPEHYTQAQLWGDDIAAIIDHLDLEQPILVGWSYGGFVICDYVRAHGQETIGGINFVSAAVTLDTAAFGVLIGPGFLEHVPGATADDFLANIQAMRAFVRGFTARPLPRDEYETALCWNIAVPARVRGALVSRVIDSDSVLRALERPVIMTHGLGDTVVLPAMGNHILKTCRASIASWYAETGHAPFLEDPLRFNGELAGLAHKAKLALRPTEVR
jgi:non-heme chloroperoxidase